LTRGTLTKGVSQLCLWKGPNWSNFQKLGCNWHFFKTRYLFETL